jgi:glycosyltransferase involved in cell wall biosynthesis
MTSMLVISEIFWPEGGGGAELATYLILDMLAKHNFDITVVTGTKSPAKIRGVKYYITPYLRASNRIVRWVNMGLLRRDERFEEMLSKHNILYIPLAAYPLIPLAKRNGLKVVVHLHNYAPIRYSSIKYYFESETLDVIKEFRYAVFHEFFIQKSVSRALLCPISYTLYLQSKKWISKADKVVCVSRRQAEIITDQAPELRDKIEVVYNPLPPEIINAEPRKELDNTPTFLYVGGDSYVKGFHILLQALNKLGKQGIKARFTLTNRYSPRSLEILKQLSDKYRNLKIQVLGRIEYSRLIELHRKAWALLFPSIWEETFGYAVVEAATLSTIPIASRVGGVTELLNDTVAQQFMVSPSSVNDLVKKISMMLSLNTDEVKVLGFKLRNEILRKLALNKIERRIIEVFEEGY